MFKKSLALKLQRFTDGEGTTTTTTTPTNTTTTTPTQTPTPSGKVFSEDYVQQLREEAKGYRLANKANETLLRTALGLTPEDELSEAKVKAWQKDQQKVVTETMAKANARLLAAEIKTLDGYNAKLVERLIDKSKVTIDENGVVTGLKEAVAELEVEYPEIKAIGSSSGSGTNPAGAAGGAKTELDQLIEDYNNAPNMAAKIAINNKIHALRSKK